MHSLCLLPDGEGSSKTTNFLTANSDNQTIGNGGRGHPQSPHVKQRNQYLLVAQDYFSKWPFAIALPDQKAATIVRVLGDQVFTMVGPPCKAFGVEKSHTTLYHPMGDGLVERMNHSLLSLLRTLTERQNDWEDYLQLLLFAYRTSQHSVTKLSPYEVLFGRNPPSLQLPLPSTLTPPDPGDYSCQLQHKLMEMWEMVEANMTEAAERQRKNYPGQNMATYVVGQKVLLDDPARGKLDPHWTGSWEVISVKGPLTLELQMGSKKRIVHVNQVRPLLVGDADRSSPLRRWLPPFFTHHESSVPAQDSETTQNSETAQDTQVSENPVGHHHTVTRSG